MTTKRSINVVDVAVMDTKTGRTRGAASMKKKPLFFLHAGIIRIAAIVFPMLVMGSGCTPPWEQPSRGGSTTSNTLTPITVKGWCLGLTMDRCKQPNCETGEMFDKARCEADQEAICDDYAAYLQLLIDEGRMEFNPEPAARCVEGYASTNRYSLEIACRNDPTAQMLKYQEDLHVRCEDGKTTWDDPYKDCSSTFTGKVAEGGACQIDMECAGDHMVCFSPEETNCGRCTRTLSTLGGPCGEQAEGPYLSCPEGTVCGRDKVCMREPHAGEPCGKEHGGCDLLCGYVCSNPEGAGTCVFVGEDNTCGRNKYCTRGNSCVLNSLESGGRDWEHGTCQPNVGLGEACSVGTNLEDYYGVVPYAGSFPHGNHPMCQTGMTCVPGEDNLNGVCQKTVRPTTGSPCRFSNECVNIQDFCMETEPGHSVCTPRLALGTECKEDYHCQPNLFCGKGADGKSLCTAYVEEGRACTDADRCDDVLECYEGVCTRYTQVENMFPTELMCK